VDGLYRSHERLPERHELVRLSVCRKSDISGLADVGRQLPTSSIAGRNGVSLGRPVVR
jgi:hypothetical protein